jgi:hypothetical protein
VRLGTIIIFARFGQRLAQSFRVISITGAQIGHQGCQGGCLRGFGHCGIRIQVTAIEINLNHTTLFCHRHDHLISSVILRGTLEIARADECYAKMGAWLVSSASQNVLSATCEMIKSSSLFSWLNLTF